VLCVAKVRPGGHSYYLEVVGTGVEAPGEWMSAGSRSLDLHGSVLPEDLGAVLSGADPSSGRRLGRWHDRVSVAGFDLTFCAPKSVSLLHALGARDVAAEVRDAHGSAVAEALDYVERRALAVRRGSGPTRELHAAEGVAAGGFVHRTSRALDPHLHTHVVMANLARAPDGSWSALDGRGVYAHKAAAGALYHVQLRHELTERLGVRWEPLTSGRADIEGIGREVRRAFSRRAAQIEENLAERFATTGTPSQRARTVAALSTRAPRDVNLAPETLRGWWEERARDVGLSPRILESTLGREPQRRHLGQLEQLGQLGQFGQLEQLEQLGQLGRSVTRRDALRAWCSVAENGATAKEVEEIADRYVSRLEPVEGWAGARDAPGVGERRHVVETRAIERDAQEELRRMDRHLAARGMSRSRDRSLGLERDQGLDVGVGMGF